MPADLRYSIHALPVPAIGRWQRISEFKGCEGRSALQCPIASLFRDLEHSGLTSMHTGLLNEGVEPAWVQPGKFRSDLR